MSDEGIYIDPDRLEEAAAVAEARHGGVEAAARALKWQLRLRRLGGAVVLSVVAVVAILWFVMVAAYCGRWALWLVDNTLGWAAREGWGGWPF